MTNLGRIGGYSYQVEWYSDDGIRKNVIPDKAFHRLEYVRTENDVGKLIVTLPRQKWNYEDFMVGDIWEVWRDKSGSYQLQNETAYFVQDWRFLTDTQGRELIEVVAYDANWLLDTAIVYIYSDIGVAEKTDYADDMIKAIVSENLGVLATPAQRQKITVAPDLSASNEITKEFAWRNVLRVCQEIAEQETEGGSYLGFDVVRTNPGEFELQTFTGQRGQDHGRDSGDMRLVGRTYGNLFEASFGTYHGSERNVIYVGGAGQGVSREKTEVAANERTYASKWNRRELFLNASNTKTAAERTSEGNAALYENRPRQVMTGRLVDIPGMRFGFEYGFGDVVSVEAFGFAVDCHVASIHTVVDQARGEHINTRLKGEL